MHRANRGRSGTRLRIALRTRHRKERPSWHAACLRPVPSRAGQIHISQTFTLEGTYHARLRSHPGRVRTVDSGARGLSARISGRGRTVRGVGGRRRARALLPTASTGPETLGVGGRGRVRALLPTASTGPETLGVGGRRRVRALLGGFAPLRGRGDGAGGRAPGRPQRAGARP